MDKIIDINTINSQIPGSPEGIISELLNASFVEKININQESRYMHSVDQ